MKIMESVRWWKKEYKKMIKIQGKLIKQGASKEDLNISRCELMSGAYARFAKALEEESG